ncbi:MAG: GNAT family N-acetyltransferase [Myxococcota bacterium]
MLGLPTTTHAQIRPATRDDLLALAAIRRRSWQATYEGVVPDAVLRGMNDQRTARTMVRGIRARTEALLVAESPDGTRLGYAWVGPHRDGLPGHHGEIYELYLDPDTQGQGIGRQLLVAAIWALVERGLQPVVVWVLAANPARQFYEACGGEPIARGWVKVGGRQLPRLALSWRGGLPLPR